MADRSLRSFLAPYIDSIIASLIWERKARNMTLQQVADLLGVTEGAVNHWEVRRRTPDLHTLRKWGAIFDLTLRVELKKTYE